MEKLKTKETCLVISTGFMALGLIYKSDVLFYIALSVGISGILIPPFAKAITWFWFKLADLLGAVMPKIFLSILYYLFLTPLALLFRLFNKDPLNLKRKSHSNSIWEERNYKYQKDDLSNPW